MSVHIIKDIGEIQTAARVDLLAAKTNVAAHEKMLVCVFGGVKNTLTKANAGFEGNEGS